MTRVRAPSPDGAHTWAITTEGRCRAVDRAA